MHSSSDPHTPLLDLRVSGLVKQVGEFTLDADFTVRVGERAALLGRSGIGKTTLLRLIAGLDSLKGQQDRGKVFLGNEEITNSPPQERGIGFIFQEPALFPSMDVLENVTFGLRMRGISKNDRKDQALVWLKKVGLTSKLNSPVGKLSGGEKQRVAFVRALIWKPRLLLLDEPFSALDTELRSILRTELLELHNLWPVPLLLVTHDEADIQAVANLRLQFNWDQKSGLRTVSRPAIPSTS